MIQPIFDHIVMEEIEQTQDLMVTPSGLHLPKGALRFDRAKVIAVGEEVKNIEVGDVILFKKNSGAFVPVYYKGSTLLIGTTRTVFGVEKRD